MKKTKRLVSIVLVLALVVAAVLTLVACDPCAKGHDYVDGVCSRCEAKDPDYKPDPTQAVYKKGTLRSFTAVMPSNWNELTYQDNNDTQILSYIGSSFFEYDYNFDSAKGGKFNEDGSINADAIIDGGFTTNYSAATALVDVTSDVDAKWGYTDAQKATGGYAWKITLREDLKWDDGTPIDADDFVYSMKEQLNPDFINYRASTYYSNIKIKNSKAYVYGKSDIIYESVASLGYKKNQEAIDAGESVVVNMWNFYGAKGAPKITSYDPTTFIPVLDYNDTCAEWIAYNDEQYYFDYAYFVGQVDEYIAALEEAETPFTGKVIKDDGSIDFEQWTALETAINATIENEDDKISVTDFFFNCKPYYDMYVAAGYFEVGGPYASYVAVAVVNTNKLTDWNQVGIYAASQYEIVICLDQPIHAVKENGELSYLAAYYLSSLPLVKESLYESCKIAPTSGATLWTTNYNTSLATSASWGPYKLAEFQSGKAYKLVRNDNWFGYGLETNKNQYNVTAIECEAVADESTQWMGFFSGKYDGIGIDTDHLEYVNSKYAYVDYGSTAYGIQIYSNLAVLKESGRNNGILAIPEFRQAMSLMMNRDDFNEVIFGTLPSSYGLIGEGYYSDVENGIVYRDTPQAKKALLRTYGFTENTDGTWTDGTNVYADVDEAYDAMTGYSPSTAKALLAEAIKELTDNAETYGYDSSKNIELLYGQSAANATSNAKQAYMQKLVDDLTKGTVLEGKIKITLSAPQGNAWSDNFKAGAYDLCIIAGIGGNIFDPFNTIGAFVNPDDSLKFSSWWDSSAEDLTLTLPEVEGVDYDGEGQTVTMSVVNWYFCLNSEAETEEQPYTFNLGNGFAPYEVRLEILAALEEYVLSKHFSIQCSFDAEMGLTGAKFSNISSDYNTFMGYGGIRYYIVNYTDAEWDAFVAANNNKLENEYKKEA